MNNNTQTPELIEDFVDSLLDDKRYCYVKNGVYYAPKAFVINAEQPLRKTKNDLCKKHYEKIQGF